GHADPAFRYLAVGSDPGRGDDVVRDRESRLGLAAVPVVYEDERPAAERGKGALEVHGPPTRAAYIKIIVRTILLVRRVSKRSPYFVPVDGVQGVRSPHRRGPGSRRDAGHHRLASGATFDRDEGGGSRARSARGGPTDLRRRHGRLGD